MFIRLCSFVCSSSSKYSAPWRLTAIVAFSNTPSNIFIRSFCFYTCESSSNSSSFPCFHVSNVSSLKVVWRKDQHLDNAIQKDKEWQLCSRVVREVLKEPGQIIPLRYLEKRRERLRLNIHAKTFVNRYPGLFDVYLDRVKPKSQPVPFLRVGHRLRHFLEKEKGIREENEHLLVAKLCKLLMMSKDKVVNADKLQHVKRDFGFPDDFIGSLVPRYPKYFRLIGYPREGKTFLELASFEEEFGKSVIEMRAEEESRLTGITMRPSFAVNFPPGFFLKKEMRKWTRDWMELPYVSPYSDVSHLDQSSPMMEKRSVAVFHELLSLAILKRVAVPIIGKFAEEYRFSNAFANTFTRHSGIFYVSLKGGIQTAMLREAYEKDELVDKDPLLAIKENFVGMLDEGRKEQIEKQRVMKEELEKEMRAAATTFQAAVDST